ncbi:hypothetical protein [Cohnella candidum]|uniref:Uncharacterized protein n=1 Tax=Cohnella candidum TaxID=2674991 RepID=A0A3G3JW66_9BACL|nr:hypothetical protein [Cohnella candidum]AYQ72434.1 hypothetical protein EAV92_07535 [Cohnella candidum]
MKKKWLMTGGAIGISGVVMLTTGFTALASTSGYDAYKSALKTTKALKSVTVQVSGSLMDNGTILEQGQGTLKANMQNEAKSGNFQISGKSGNESLQLFAQNNGEVWKTSNNNTYYLKQDKADQEEGNHQEGKSAWMDQQAETVVDALVGNLKNYVQSTTQSDGSKQISVQLSQTQIPAVVQALAPLALHRFGNENGDSNEHKDQQDPERAFGETLLLNQVLPITQDIQIQSFRLDATINASNQIESQQASITFTGKDTNGNAHTVSFDFDAKLTGFDQTVPDTIDLTGKTVKTVQDRHEGHNHED